MVNGKSGGERYDVVILGGGLAGLTLALQLRKTLPTRTIAVVEVSSYPLPDAAHKVGESTVELGAHYFAETIGLRDYLVREQLPKLGLRFFFPAGDNSAIGDRLEVGASRFPPTPSYQLDRGRLESELMRRWREQGSLMDETRVKRIVLGQGGAAHTITVETGGVERAIVANWLVDAGGRAGLLRGMLRLGRKSTHRASGAWFRLATKIDLNDWQSGDDWCGRLKDGRTRWLSTNHLMGRGYWVWLIPLSSGATSVGIVTDEEIHPLRTYNSFERAMGWLNSNEPRCAEAIRSVESTLLDFKMLKNYAIDCQRVFSGDRWCMTGEAGVFLDPFYSPGSDFIALANTFITDLIRQDYEGGPVAPHAEFYNQLYLTLYRNTAKVYEHQYQLFGNQQVMSTKIVWDFAVYWSFTAFLFLRGRLLDLKFLQAMRPTMERMGHLNTEIQDVFRRWHEKAPGTSGAGFVDLLDIPFLYQLNAGLSRSGDALSAMVANIELLEQIAAEIRAAHEAVVSKQVQLPRGPLLGELFRGVDPVR